ncbi:hypothetical protein DFP72DRAFT_847739 [Ephemerocybe angulata]|uniref:CxC2-like cysteine cluster KDZ transposase-associated domain-containing protein n=1 Tax=Ephemerocybe angulata TaxID=980116 RepID=A0A8H6HZK6_9AGAR|nr:hypothetical protein DFP72DRAFT_847739 [Tulosesus angulatus]
MVKHKIGKHKVTELDISVKTTKRGRQVSSVAVPAEKSLYRPSKRRKIIPVIPADNKAQREPLYYESIFETFDGKTSQGKTTHDYLKAWLDQGKCGAYLDRLLITEAMPKPTCVRCLKGVATWRCLDCGSQPQYCGVCCRISHWRTPFHRVEYWKGGYFQPAWLWQVGTMICLGHQGHMCPEYQKKMSDLEKRSLQVNGCLDSPPLEEDDTTFGAKPAITQLGNGRFVLFVHLNGFHYLPVYPCLCGEKVRLPEDEQFLEAGYFPSTWTTIETVFTLELLKDYHLTKTETKMSTENYCDILKRKTNFAFPSKIRHGFGHEGRGRKPEKGELALYCAICPQPGINLPPNWESLTELWLYKRYIVIDGNFKLHHLIIRGQDRGISLIAGAAYMIEKAYQDKVLKNAPESKQTGRLERPLSVGSTPSDRHRRIDTVGSTPSDGTVGTSSIRRVDTIGRDGRNHVYPSDRYRRTPSVGKTQAATCSEYKAVQDKDKMKKGYDASGLFGSACARHGCFCGGALVDMQKGERQANADLSVNEAFDTTNAAGTPGALLAYDINCQFCIHFWERIDKAHHLTIPADLDITYLIGLFHIHGHGEICLPRFASTFLPGAGMASGEIIESLWSILNQAARITKTMTPAHRQEMIDACVTDINWKKLVSVDTYITTQLLKARTEKEKADDDFALLNDTVSPTQKELWQEEMETANDERKESDVSSMDSYLPKLEKVKNTRAIRSSLMAEEQKTRKNVGLANWVATGMEIQEAQNATEGSVTDLDVQKKREVLIKQIDNWYKIADTLFPGLDPTAETSKMTDKRDPCVCENECQCPPHILPPGYTPPAGVMSAGSYPALAATPSECGPISEECKPVGLFVPEDSDNLKLALAAEWMSLLGYMHGRMHKLLDFFQLECDTPYHQENWRTWNIGLTLQGLMTASDLGRRPGTFYQSIIKDVVIHTDDCKGVWFALTGGLITSPVYPEDELLRSDSNRWWEDKPYATISDVARLWREGGGALRDGGNRPRDEKSRGIDEADLQGVLKGLIEGLDASIANVEESSRDVEEAYKAAYQVRKAWNRL